MANAEIRYGIIPAVLPTNTTTDECLSAVLLTDGTVMCVYSTNCTGDYSDLWCGYAASEDDFLFASNSLTDTRALFTHNAAGVDGHQRFYAHIQRLPPDGGGNEYLGLTVFCASGGAPGSHAAAPAEGTGVEAWPMPGAVVTKIVMYRSTDEGDTWSVRGTFDATDNWNTPFDMNNAVSIADGVPPGEILDTSYPGASDTWHTVAPAFYRYTGAPTFWNGGIIWVSTDYGVTWQSIDDGSSATEPLPFMSPYTAGMTGRDWEFASRNLTGGVDATTGLLLDIQWRQNGDNTVGTEAKAFRVPAGASAWGSPYETDSVAVGGDDVYRTETIASRVNGTEMWTVGRLKKLKATGFALSMEDDDYTLEDEDSTINTTEEHVLCHSGREYVWWMHGAYVSGIRRSEWKIGAAEI